MDTTMITTAFELPGHRIVQSLGVARGVSIRSRSMLDSFEVVFERARQEAFELMAQHAAELGANALVGMRYDTSALAEGVVQVLAYGTAVIVERD